VIGRGRGRSEIDPRRLLDDERFLRGLGLGALIGAAIAGSTLWSRLRRTSRNAGNAQDHIQPSDRELYPPIGG
jgi:hypothetical protein